MDEEQEFYLHAIFNNKTRKLTCFTFDLDSFPESIRKNMLIRTYSFKDLDIPDENINLTRFRWEGDYDDGELVDIVKENRSVVSERDIDNKYRALFFKKYPLEDIIFEIVLNLNMQTDNGKKMKTFLEKVLARRAKDKEFFKNSSLHIWEEEGFLVDKQKEAFE